MVAEHAPGRTGTSNLPVDFIEVVCADPDLLALEFDALIAANYPGPADRPHSRPPRRAARLLTWRLPFTPPSASTTREQPQQPAAEHADEERARARQRGPPAATWPED
jgi:hypothetical protein